MNFAIAGAGYIANIHATAIHSLPGARLVAVVGRYTDNSVAFASKFGVQEHYDTVEEALKLAHFDALVIGTPNYLHAPQALAALRAGVPVMVEKPMAMNPKEGEEMLEASLKANTPLMVAHCWRFDEEVLWLKRQAGRLGKIIRTKGLGVHTNWGPAGWFTQKEFAGGGALADMGVHAVDTARFLLGDPQPCSVFARLGTYYRDFDVDDTGLVIVSWEGGAVSYIESGWWQPHSDGPEAATQLYGQQGFGQLFPTYLELPDPAQPKVEKIDPGFVFPRPEHCPQAMYDRQMAYFVDCIQAGSMPLPGGAEGLVNMKIIAAAYESSRSGQVIEL